MRKDVSMKDTAESRVRRDPALGKVSIETFRSGGPGGQHQNKTSSCVRVRAAVLDDALLAKLRSFYPGSVTDSGELLSESRSQRSQPQNRNRAFVSVEKKLISARAQKRNRRRTKPSRAKNEKRLERKRRTGEKKKSRQKPRDW